MVQHRSPLQTLALVLALGAMPALASCAQAPMTASAPAAAAPEPAPAKEAPMAGAAADASPGDLQGQIAALDEAEAKITQLFGDKREAEEAKPAAGPSKTPSRATDQATGVKKDKGAEQLAQGAQGDACSTACSALSSMERAASHLCELAGEGDQRCGDARARVRTATDRVRGACPVCAGR